MGIYPGFTASQFGSKNNSVNYGIMFIGFALAGFLGPMSMNSLFAALALIFPPLGLLPFLVYLVSGCRCSFHDSFAVEQVSSPKSRTKAGGL